MKGEKKDTEDNPQPIDLLIYHFKLYCGVRTIQ